ncbi:hypothetical protein K439DRAFT_1622855 [Ramaria rubella]|nr:hypothetical protein K439DRAFT_1622855 [Ramaria rubella]
MSSTLTWLFLILSPPQHHTGHRLCIRRACAATVDEESKRRDSRRAGLGWTYMCSDSALVNIQCGHVGTPDHRVGLTFSTTLFLWLKVEARVRAISEMPDLGAKVVTLRGDDVRISLSFLILRARLQVAFFETGKHELYN